MNYYQFIIIGLHLVRYGMFIFEVVLVNCVDNEYSMRQR